MEMAKKYIFRGLIRLHIIAALNKTLKQIMSNKKEFLKIDGVEEFF